MDDADTSSVSQQRSPPWSAGTATRTITPDEPMWMAGFFARDEPSQGIHKDLHAKALALSDEAGNTAVIASVELLFVGHQLRTAVAERCAETYDLEPRRLLLNATHTHQGPVTRTATTGGDTEGGGQSRPKSPDRIRFLPLEAYGVDEKYQQRAVEYRDSLVETLVSLVGDALDDRRPAELTYGHGRCGSAMSRRRPYEDGISFTPYAGGPVDHDVPVLSVEDPTKSGDDAIFGLVFGYACHTTVQHLTEFSGDWAGYTQEILEDRYPNATALFLQGCGGDQKAYPEREQRYVEGHARAVALGVEAALQAERRPVRGPLTVAYEEIDIAFEDPPSRAELEEMADADDEAASWRASHLLATLDEYGSVPREYPYPIQALGFGTDLTMVALAGEVLVEYSLRLTEELDGPVWVSGYSNDAFTYVPTKQAIYDGGYEGGNVIRLTTAPGTWKPDIEDRIVSATRSLVARVQTPDVR
ncbi:hypothetical protein [Haloarchaeobius sp. DFWS5]|uniref:hypothetical protein n=1 Tax=Haloarchaeobius sp. DFWS5 TaxID=3446114 RepID=UPI003EBCBC6F